VQDVLKHRLGPSADEEEAKWTCSKEPVREMSPVSLSKRTISNVNEDQEPTQREVLEFASRRNASAPNLST
jgi:hypothetical protein